MGHSRSEITKPDTMGPEFLLTQKELAFFNSIEKSLTKQALLKVNANASAKA